jgi:hypothetical protein
VTTRRYGVSGLELFTLGMLSACEPEGLCLIQPAELDNVLIISGDDPVILEVVVAASPGQIVEFDWALPDANLVDMSEFTEGDAWFSMVELSPQPTLDGQVVTCDATADDGIGTLEVRWTIEVPPAE